MFSLLAASSPAWLTFINRVYVYKKSGGFVLNLALVNHNENEFVTTYPPPYMQPHNGGEPYAYELHTDESACQSSFRYLKFTRFRYKG